MAHLESAQRTTKPPGSLLRTLGLLYALVAFVTALALFVYAIPFLSNLRYLKRPIVTPTIDLGSSSALPWAILVDVCLILLFGLQHSLMARGGFKRWLARNVPGAGWSGQPTCMPPTWRSGQCCCSGSRSPPSWWTYPAMRPLMTAIYWRAG